MTATINTAIAHLASAGGGLLQFYVVRHTDYGLLTDKAGDGDQEAAAICAIMTSIAQGMSSSDHAASCLICDRIMTFRGSGAVAIVGPSPIQPGARCVFRLLCVSCCDVADPDLMRVVTDRWRVVVTPNLRVLPPMHEAGRA